MRCLACNKLLNDYEATRKYESTGEFVDLCNGCFGESDVKYLPTLDRPDLQEYEDVNDDEGVIEE